MLMYTRLYMFCRAWFRTQIFTKHCFSCKYSQSVYLWSYVHGNLFSNVHICWIYELVIGSFWKEPDCTDYGAAYTCRWDGFLRGSNSPSFSAFGRRRPPFGGLVLVQTTQSQKEPRHRVTCHAEPTPMLYFESGPAVFPHPFSHWVVLHFSDTFVLCEHRVFVWHNSFCRQRSDLELPFSFHVWVSKIPTFFAHSFLVHQNREII